jgi:hypothetical protein
MRRLLPWVALLALLPACAAKIGDSCTTNLDCDPLGERICDTAQEGGYCTLDTCDEDSCPDDALCISFFPTQLSDPCDPATEDAVNLERPNPDGSCPTGSTCATNDCTADEFCLTSGFCVNWTQERRFCMKPCSNDGDCRSGYECRHTGTRGAEVVPDPEQNTVKQAKFCGPRT